MGYDVTFHPAALADLQRYVFDIVDKPGAAKERAREITKVNGKATQLVDGILSRLPAFADELKGQKGEEFGNTVAFAAAAVMGYVHPFWYARGSALTFLVAQKLASAKEIPFVPLPSIAKGGIAKLKDASGGYLSANYTASGFLPPESVGHVEALLERLAKPGKGKKQGALLDVFDADGLDSLKRALKYAREHGLGLMEATDVVVPIANEAFTDLDNLRAHWLKNVEYDLPGAPPTTKKGKKASPAKKKASPAKKKAPPAKKKAPPAKKKASPAKKTRTR